MELERKLPASPEAERVVLGAVVVGHPQSAEVFDLLEPEDFNDPRNQLIFRTLQRMWTAGKPVELPNLFDELNGEQKLDSAGGAGFISGLGDGIYNKLHVDRYGVEIRESRVARDFIRSNNEFTDVAFKGGDMSRLLDEARERIAKLSNLHAVKDHGKTFRDASADFISQLYEPYEEPLGCAIQEVDDRTGGFRAGELAIITADTGVGKTFFALQIARAGCYHNKHMLYCSGEMLAAHLMGRVLSSASGLSYTKLRKKQYLTEEEKLGILEVGAQQCSDCRIIDGELTLPRIRTIARSLKGKLGGLIVDYDELVEVRVPVGNRDNTEWEQQRVLVRAMKSIAMDLEIPVLVVSQLRKALNPEERKNPTLQRLYGSGAKAKHASVVLYVDRPFVQNLTGDETEAAVYVLKARDGRIGKTECTFNLRTLTFEERQMGYRDYAPA